MCGQDNRKKSPCFNKTGNLIATFLKSELNRLFFTKNVYKVTAKS